MWNFYTTSMDTVFTGETYLFRGRWCVIGPCVGVQQAGTELCNPGSINPSELIHLSRILSRTSRYPYIIGGNNDRNSQEYKKQKQNRDAKTKVLHGFRRVSAAAHSIAVIPSSRNKLPSVQRLPLASSFLADLYQKVPRALWWTELDPLAVLVRTGVQTNSAWGVGKQQPSRVAKWSSTLFPLSICQSVPQPPLHTSERCLSLVGHLLWVST